MEERIRVGLVGFGLGSSVFHAPLIQSLPRRFEITHVLERSASRSQVLTPAPEIVRSMDALLATNVELVVISTPTSLHFEQAKQAMLAKRHVIVDKPLCQTTAQAQELMDLANRQGVLFSVFQNRRWDSDFLTVRKLIESGAFGQVTHYEAHFDRYRPSLKGTWKDAADMGGGTLYDLGAHLVDQTLQLFGQPDDVDADVQIQREGAMSEDYFCLQFKYVKRPELKVILTAGNLVQDAGPKYIVKGSEGTFEKGGEDVQEQWLKEGLRPTDGNGEDNGWGKEPDAMYGTFKDNDGNEKVIPSERGAYLIYYTNIAEAIRCNAQLLVDPKTVIPQIRILEEAKKTQRDVRAS